MTNLDIWKGDSYKLNPNTLKFDTKIAGFNQVKPIDEYNALKTLMIKLGQIDPIIIRNGLVIDGRHRSKVAIELGIDVLARDVVDDLEDKDCIALSNLNTFAARNDSTNQKAFKTVALIKSYGYTQTAAMKLTGLSNRRYIIAAQFILDNAAYNAKYYLDLMAGKRVKVTVFGTETVEHTKSLLVLKTLLAKNEEAEASAVNTESELALSTNAEEHIDYDSMLRTETGRYMFWSSIGRNSAVDVGTKIMLINTINTAYKSLEKPLAQPAMIDDDLEHYDTSM